VLKEFKDFVNRGNFVDIAVAFVIGSAFGAVTSAFTDRLVSPLIGLIGGRPNFDDVGRFACEATPEGEMCAGSVGAFLTALANFLIVAFVMFLIVKAYNAFKDRNAEPEKAPGAAPPQDIVLLTEIRDALRARG
jgi:large conductance mechanosensitive channel